MKNAIFILSAFMRDERGSVNCEGRKTRKLKISVYHIF